MRAVRTSNDRTQESRVLSDGRASPPIRIIQLPLIAPSADNVTIVEHKSREATRSRRSVQHAEALLAFINPAVARPAIIAFEIANGE
jgi:hypothetical protein